jgi:hypothetical protein
VGKGDEDRREGADHGGVVGRGRCSSLSYRLQSDMAGIGRAGLVQYANRSGVAWRGGEPER